MTILRCPKCGKINYKGKGWLIPVKYAKSGVIIGVNEIKGCTTIIGKYERIVVTRKEVIIETYCNVCGYNLTNICNELNGNGGVVNG